VVALPSLESVKEIASKKSRQRNRAKEIEQYLTANHFPMQTLG
jgi:hypothetical protein